MVNVGPLIGRESELTQPLSPMRQRARSAAYFCGLER